MKQIDSIRLLQKIAIVSNEATTVEEALQVCLDEICAVTKWPVGHVYLHSGDVSDELVSTRIWHLDDPEKFASFKKVTEITSFEAGIGLPGRVYASGEPAWISDIKKDPNFPRAQLAKITEVKAGFAFPVKVGSEVIAVLEFYSPKVVSPKQDLLDVIVQAGEQISHVIKRNRTENEMQQHAEIINQIQDVVITTNVEGVIKSWNKGAEEQLGYTDKEMIGKPVDLVYLQPERKVMHSATIDALIEKKRIGYETVMRRKSGVVFPVYLSQSLCKDIKGRITGIIHYSSDITQQKQAEAVLEQVKVIDQIHDAVISTDPKGCITLWNRGAEILYGYTAEEILGETIYQLYPMENESTPPSEFLEIIKNKGGIEIESLMRKKSGEDIYVHNALSALTDEKGNITGVISYAMDISGHMRAEEELRNYEKIVSGSSDLVAILNENYIIEACNKQYLVYRNKKRDEIIGTHVSGVNEAGYFDNVLKQLLDRCLAGETIRLQHWRNYEGVGKRYMDQQISPFSDTGGETKALVTSRDITDLKHAEEELQQIHQRLTYHTEHSPLAVIEFDKDFKVKRWTKTAEKIFGWKAEEIIGKHLYEWKFVYEEDKGSVDDILDDLSRGNELSYINLNRNYAKDGRVIDCEWYNSVLLDDDGNIESVLSLGHDITERKQAERELQHLNQRLALHLENTPLALIEWDKDFSVTHWSKRAEQVFGWKEEEIIGKHPYEWKFIHEGDKEITDTVLEDVSVERMSSNITHNRNYTKDGRILDCEWYNSLLYDDEHKFVTLFSLMHDITERKQAEKELQLLNQRLTLHMENSPLGMLEMDRDFRVIGWSKQAEQIFGWKEDEVINKLLSEVGLVYDEDVASVDKKFDDLAAGKIQNLVNLNRNYTKDGRVLDCEWYNSAVVDENGELVSILALAHDITERKQAEKDRLIFEQLITVSADFMAVINDKYEFDAVNQKYCEAMGKTREEIVGTHIREITGEKAFTEEFEPILNKCFAGQPVRIQAWRDYPVIGRRYTDVLYTRYQDITSGEYKAAAVARDITDLRKAEEELHRFERMVSASKDPMVLINKDYIVEACNPQYCEMRGVKPDDILGKHIDDINKGNYFKSNLKDTLDRCLAGETVRLQHWRKYPALEKDTYMDIQFVRYKDEDVDEPKILAMGRDITELKLAEEQLDKYRKHLEDLVEERTEELKATQEELVKKERLAVLGQLTAKVSHELRNPLGTIRSSLYTINNKVANQDFNLDVMLNRADRNIKRCVNIIEQMLIYVPTSHYGIHGIALTDIDECITEILDEYEFAESIKVKRILDAGVSVKCEEENIRRCIINVITNACQAMEDNKTQSNNDNKSNKLLIKTFTIDNKLIIEITDTGIGIPEDKIVRIFEPLFSTKIYGVGLGLPIVKQVMEQYHGGIEVNSVENKGTHVKLWLPLNCEQAEVEHE